MPQKHVTTSFQYMGALRQHQTCTLFFRFHLRAPRGTEPHVALTVQSKLMHP